MQCLRRLDSKIYIPSDYFFLNILTTLDRTRRSKIVSRASAMSIEHLLCATVPKVAFVIVLKDACLIGVSLFTVKVSH